MASAITKAGSRDAALAATAALLADETDGAVGAWRRSDGVLIFIAAEGLEADVRRRLIEAASPWRGADDAALRKLARVFARLAGTSKPTIVDVGVGCIVLSEECPEVQASRAELTIAISALPEVDPLIVLEDPGPVLEAFEIDAVRRLTPREREILDLIALGLGTKQIAGRLVISPKTVKTHAQNILAKLGVGSRLEAVALLRRLGSAVRDDAGE